MYKADDIKIGGIIDNEDGYQKRAIKSMLPGPSYKERLGPS